VVDKDGGSPVAPFIISLLATVDKEDERAGWDGILSGAYHEFPPFDKNKKFRDYFEVSVKQFGNRAFGGTELKPAVFNEWEKIFEGWNPPMVISIPKDYGSTPKDYDNKIIKSISACSVEVLLNESQFFLDKEEDRKISVVKFITNTESMSYGGFIKGNIRIKLDQISDE